MTHRNDDTKSSIARLVLVEALFWAALGAICLTSRNLSWLPIVLLAGMFARRLSLHQPLIPSEVRAPLLLWLLLLVMSLSIAIQPEPAWTRGWAYVFGFVTLSTVLNIATIDSNAPRMLLRIWLLSGIGIALIGLFITGFSGKFPFLSPFLNLFPSQLIKIQNSLNAQEGLNPNVLGGSLTPFLYIGIVAFFQKQTLKVERMIGLFSSALFVFVVLLSQSRGAWIGAVVGAIALLALHKPKLLFLSIPVVIASLFFRDVILTYLQNADLDSLTSNRLALWQTAFYLIQDFMFTGLGLNMFAPVSRLLYPHLLSTSEVLIHPHNMWLTLWLDFGLFGVVACFWVTFRVWKAGILFLRSVKNSDEEKWLMRSLLAGQAAWLAFNLTDYTNLGGKQGFIFWAAWGIILGLSRASNEIHSEASVKMTT
jgi:O-antigen ligase